MATENIEFKQSIFDRIESEIVNAFNLMIHHLTMRRDALLAELKNSRFAFEEKTQTRIDGLKELEQMRAQLLELSIKQNFILKVQKASLAPIEQQLNELKGEPVSEPLLRFEIPLTEMLTKTETLGAIFDKRTNVTSKHQIDYSHKNIAQKVIGKKGSGEGEFLTPLRMHICEGHHLYVVDSDNKRIQVFDVESGKYLLQFGRSHFTQPSGVVTLGKYCYVTDRTLNKIFKFEIGDYKLIKKSKAGGSYRNLSHPTGIAVTDDEVVYVVDFSNSRVCAYDRELRYVSELGVGTLNSPSEVKICSELIYVIDVSSHCLHCFDKSGKELRSFLTCGIGKQILGPSTFCFDGDKNIIIADHDAQTLKIFSPSGELLHQIGKEVPDTEDVGDCFGVVLFGQNIFVTCANLDSIKIFWNFCCNIFSATL